MATIDTDPKSDDRQAGPTVARMLVGARLHELREARGISRAEAAYVIRASASKMSRMERGLTGFKHRDVTDLLTLYGMDGETDDNADNRAGGEAERATLLARAGQANRPGWWRPYSNVVPAWFEQYLGLEQAASVIRTYQLRFIPDLLQTMDYARAVIQLDPGEADEPWTESRTRLRIHRQWILRRSNPPHLWMIIDEAALRRPVGGAATMRAQLGHLIATAELPHVTIQILPFSAGGHMTTAGPVTYLRLPQQNLPDVVYLEQLTGGRYTRREPLVHHYWNVLNHLATDAEPPENTATILRSVLDQT